MAEKGEPIRLQRSLLREVRKLAEEEGTSVAGFVNVAVAEKSGALRTARFFAERAARADVPTGSSCDVVLAPAATSARRRDRFRHERES